MGNFNSIKLRIRVERDSPPYFNNDNLTANLKKKISIPTDLYSYLWDYYIPITSSIIISDALFCTSCISIEKLSKQYIHWFKKLNNTKKRCLQRLVKKSVPLPTFFSPHVLVPSCSLVQSLPHISTNFLIVWVISHRHYLLTSWRTNEDLAHSHSTSLFLYLLAILVTLNNKTVCLAV